MQDKYTSAVLFSGGQDSTTVLVEEIAAHTAEKVLAVSVQYGQLHAVEMDAATEIVRRLKVDRVVLPFAELRVHLGGALVGKGDIPSAVGDGVAPTFVPGRNLLFASLALAVSYPLGVRRIVLGVNAVDYSGYPDCRRAFVLSLQETMIAAVDDSVMTVAAPLLECSKADIFAMANAGGYLSLITECTHTCYRGNHTTWHDWGYGCGECPACIIRAQGWEEFRLRCA